MCAKNFSARNSTYSANATYLGINPRTLNIVMCNKFGVIRTKQFSFTIYLLMLELKEIGKDTFLLSSNKNIYKWSRIFTRNGRK